jgi:hypothetical protein
MGFTNSRLLIRWLDPSSLQVKHAFAVKFDKYCTPLSPSDHVHPGSFLLSNPSSSTTLPEYTINVSDQPSFDGPLFQLHLALLKVPILAVSFKRVPTTIYPSLATILRELY